MLFSRTRSRATLGVHAKLQKRHVWSDEPVHIIVVGCGRVGSELAMELSEEGHSVVVIDKNRDNLRRLTHFHGKTIVGSGFDRDVLFQAEATTADALAAVTSGDNTNILCARIARDHYNIKNVVARIYDPARADIYMKLGIPTVATSLVDDPAGEALDVALGRLH